MAELAHLAAGPCVSRRLDAWQCPSAPKACLQGEQAEHCCRRVSDMSPVQLQSRRDATAFGGALFLSQIASPGVPGLVHHTLKRECNLRPAGLMLVVLQESLSPCSPLALILQGACRPSGTPWRRLPAAAYLAHARGLRGQPPPVRLEQSEPSQPPRGEQLFQASSNQKQDCRAGGKGVSPSSPAALQGWLEITCAVFCQGPSCLCQGCR